MKHIKISETLRVGSTVCGVAGMWQHSENTIIIKRDQLTDLNLFAGTLLHEVAHAVSGCPDIDGGFELMLSKFLGEISVKSLKLWKWLISSHVYYN